MTRIVALSLIVASLSTVVGCGASGPSAPSAATPSNVADARDESIWTAPEEVVMSINDSKDAAPSLRDQAQGSFRPNRQDRPSRGAIHAATY